MFKNYGKLFVMLLVLGVAGQVFGGPTTTLVKQKTLEPKTSVKDDEQKQRLTPFTPATTDKKAVKGLVPSVTLTKDNNGKVYVALEKISEGTYHVPMVMKDSDDDGVFRAKQEKLANVSEHVIDGMVFTWVEIGTLDTGKGFYLGATPQCEIDNKDQLDRALRGDNIYNLFCGNTPVEKTIQTPINTVSTSFLDSTLGKTIVYGGAAAVTALVGWWWFSRAK